MLLVVAAIAPGLFSAANPLGIAPREAFSPPSALHLFGTDQSGRDIFSRVVYGARQSLLLGAGAISISMVFAIALGLLGGLGGRLTERAVAWSLDVLFSFPP